MRPDRAQFRDGARYAAAVASEIAAPVLRAAAHAISRGTPTDPSRWRSGLILGNGHIGDVLYRTCSLDALADAVPGCRWTYLTTPLAAEVLTGNPALVDVSTAMTSDVPTLLDSARRRTLRDRRFDVALCTENVRHHSALILATLLGIPNRVAFTQKGFSGLATRGVRLHGVMSRPAQFRYMVQSLTPVPLVGPLRPRVYPSPADVADAGREWARLYPGGAGAVVACAVTTRQRIGAFPPEFFASVLASIMQFDPSAHVLLVGSAADRAVLEPLATQPGARCAVSAGSIGLRAVVSLLERCDAFIGSDSGPRHLANAAGIPVFFVRNMGTSEIEAGAYCDTEHDVAPHGEYLSAADMRRALERVDVAAVARTIVDAVRRERATGTRQDTPR